MIGAASATGIMNIVISARNRRSRTTRRSVDPSKIGSSGSLGMQASAVADLVRGSSPLDGGLPGQLVIRRGTGVAYTHRRTVADRTSGTLCYPSGRKGRPRLQGGRRQSSPRRPRPP